MTIEVGAPIILNQCLFGYENGHRLLASSVRLPEEAASFLLLHSDLAPGLTRHASTGYLTGLPLPAARAYALMRTWPAPEMSRPGCVWTHAVLIPFSEMARFSDMSVLLSVLSRPTTSRLAEYEKQLTLVHADTPTRPEVEVLFGEAVEVIRSQYAPKANGNLRMLATRKLEDLVMALWSQQWPRLRRSFSFNCAEVRRESRSTQFRFDLQVVEDVVRSVARSDAIGPVEDWEEAAAVDLLRRNPAQFRRFIWRYGSDVRRGRERYRFLAQLFVDTRIDRLEGGLLVRLLDEIANDFPDPREAALLKEDLVSCGSSEFTLLPSTDPLDTLAYLSRHAAIHSLPQPPAAAVALIGTYWPARAGQVLAVAEEAVSQNAESADALVDLVLSLIDSNTFFAVTNGHPYIRRLLAQRNPRLLDSKQLGEVPVPELFELVTAVSQADPSLVRTILRRLLALDDVAVSDWVMGHFPETTVEVVVEAMAREFAGARRVLPRAWREVVRQRSGAVLPQAVLGRAKSTSALAACAVLLNLSVDAGLRASTSLWADVVRSAIDDVTGVARQRTLAYFISLALAGPTRGCEALFELAFQAVHDDIARSALPEDAFSALAPYLPDLHWWQQWDTCLRLRRGVVNAYLDYGLAMDSFHRLCTDDALRQKMDHLIADSGQGARLI